MRTRAQKTVARDERIIAAYTDGCSAYEIAIRETISAATVYYVLNRAQVTQRPREWYAAQKQRCGRGQLLDEHNTRIERTGARRCRTCARDRGRAWAQARANARPDRLKPTAGSGAACSIKPYLERRSLRAAHHDRRLFLLVEASAAHFRPRPIGSV